MKKIFARMGVAAAATLASAASMAATTGNVNAVSTGAQDAFTGFRDTVLTWAKGPLGTGLAVTMMLMGAGVGVGNDTHGLMLALLGDAEDAGVAKNTPMPALSGVAGAAFLNWGPGIIMSMTEGALL